MYQMDHKPHGMHLHRIHTTQNAFSFIWIVGVNIAVTKLEVRNPPAKYSQEKC